MDLLQFKKWKLLFEDDDQCFSKAIIEFDQTEVVLITYFSIEQLSIATRHLFSDGLYNYIDLIEDETRLHLVLKHMKGQSLKTFLKDNMFSYEDRINLSYEYLKSLVKYDNFSNAIKIQLVDEEQLIIKANVIYFRELIDYTHNKVYTSRDVFKQLGQTLETILHDAKGYHNQFIDNLIIGNNPYQSFQMLKENFRDVFIFEKEKALESISYEYTIFLNDITAGPNLGHIETTEQNAFEVEAKIVAAVDFDLKPDLLQPDTLQPDTLQPDLLQPDLLQRELFDLLKDVPNQEFQTEFDLTDETIPESNHEKVSILIDSSVNDKKGVTDIKKIDASIQKDIEDIDPETVENKVTDDELMPPTLPRSNFERFLDHDEDLLDDGMSDLFDQEHVETPKAPWVKWLIVSVSAIAIIFVLYLGLNTFVFKNDPVVAQFTVEPLYEDRIAFMNTSTGDKNIASYQWDVYYNDVLIQSFEDENFFPLFETEGDYKIELKVQDKDGTWSDTYSYLYEFKK